MRIRAIVNSITLAGRSPKSNPLRLHLPGGGLETGWPGARCGAVRFGVEVDVSYLNANIDDDVCGKCIRLADKDAALLLEARYRASQP